MGVDFIITYFKFFCTIMKLIRGCTYSKLAEEAQKKLRRFMNLMKMSLLQIKIEKKFAL